VILAAFKNNCPEVGLKYLRELSGIGKEINSALMLHLVKSWAAISSQAIKQEYLEALVKNLRASEFWIPVETMEEMEKRFQEIGCKTVKLMIKSNGICPSCKTKLEQISFCDEDFGEMKEAIAKNVIEELIYAKTTPKEYERFKQFVAETAPYDIVVDGLNVMLGGNEVGFKAKFDKLCDTLKTLKKIGFDRILLIGRRHMRYNYQSASTTGLDRLARCFYLENISEDDPFFLYSAMFSGPDTKIISRDLLRDHKAKLPPKAQKTFELWARRNRIVLLHYDKWTRSVKLKMQETHWSRAQSNGTHWHLPYVLGADSLEEWEVPRTWLCVTKK